jgi:hypothetical protein
MIMLNDSERQTIREVLDACKIHYKAVKACILRPQTPGNELGDIMRGLDISISKLEYLLRPATGG